MSLLFNLIESKFKKYKVIKPLYGSHLKSHFTKSQVKNIVLKTSNRSLIEKYFKLNDIEKGTEEYLNIRRDLHRACERLLTTYGDKILTFIHDMNFINREEMSNRITQSDPDFDDSQIYLDTFEVVCESYQNYFIAFEESNYFEKPNLLICNNERQLIARVEPNGFIEKPFREKLNQYDIQQIMGGRLVSYEGEINNKCFKCGTKLKRKDSFYFGIGPKCAASIHSRYLEWT